ncbi:MULTISPECIES: MBL fold metallo-hydrolase [unclassified Paenibacillus]|uniref:MBL fold metallo-hydrolase n=1 Tax=unclassified Paenibacillus TaxID=185978 RepID=UPI001045C3B7|nr:MULTISPECIES: MBL fold metallo-hydrolase [unclassified Paenibacillus]NIK70245.1 glyoxylase-like metal-dependent hydrolase (beta-lactamase superfamily II) [Paenibacillus sp. BK720]TCM98072.1 glyoxylase-like metal-dependent hydrolase (beta-lactamase superfamily II) [Paenibacillus sp. BK033]
MRMTRHEQVYQLTFMPTMFPVNCYLVEEEKSLTLIDAAMPGNAEAILKAAKQIGKPITRIVLTHAHSDHIGALDALRQQLTDVTVYISARDSRLLNGDRSLDPNEPDTPIRGGVPKPGKIATRSDVLLQDGDRVGSLLAISTPGHTPGSMSFLDSRSHALIAGDAFQVRGGIAVSGQVRWKFPFPAMATWNKVESLRSAMKLLTLKPSLLAVGHGDLIVKPEALMELAIQHASSKLDTVIVR